MTQGCQARVMPTPGERRDLPNRDAGAEPDFGAGKPIGTPKLEVDADPREWEVFSAVDRRRGDSLLVLWWGGAGPSHSW